MKIVSFVGLPTVVVVIQDRGHRATFSDTYHGDLVMPFIKNTTNKSNVPDNLIQKTLFMEKTF